MHVHRRLHLPDNFPRSVWSKKADDVGIFRPRTVDDDALRATQLFAAAIQREFAAGYSICKCGVLVHVHADLWVSL